MIVDAHHHLWDPSRRAYPWMTEEVASIARPFTEADLRERLPHGVSQTIVVQAVSSLEETIELLDAAHESTLLAGVVGWIDLQSPDAAGQVAQLRGARGGDRLAGIRHQVHDEEDPRWLLRPQVLHGLRAVSDARLVFDLLVRSRELPAACEVAAQLPDLQLVVDHGAKPAIAAREWSPWAGQLKSLAQYSNVSCKLSGLVTEANWNTWTEDEIVPYARHILDVFGPDRVMFGSDWPVCLLAASYERVLELTKRVLQTLPAEKRRAVLAENAARIYRLPRTA
ncbi:MAG TPA: amidohydrolase family protein [Candidatus Baltobacteraceae bacterium]|nr:amidohydrolase family protein [Candidatus Baltobacteraceae bacterium]